MDSNNCPPWPLSAKNVTMQMQRGDRSETTSLASVPVTPFGVGGSAALAGPSPIASTAPRTQTSQSRNGQEAALMDLTERIRVARSKVPEMLTLCAAKRSATRWSLRTYTFVPS